MYLQFLRDLANKHIYKKYKNLQFFHFNIINLILLIYFNQFILIYLLYFKIIKLYFLIKY